MKEKKRKESQWFLTKEEIWNALLRLWAKMRMKENVLFFLVGLSRWLIQATQEKIDAIIKLMMAKFSFRNTYNLTSKYKCGL